MKRTLLVIDDEQAILHAFRRAFPGPGVQLLTASTATEGLELVRRHRPDAVVLDLNLPDSSGLETFQRIHELDARIPVIFITGHGTTETAIEAMKHGAFEYLLKPLELDQFRELVRRAFEISRLMRVPAVPEEHAAAPESADLLVGRCPAMQEVYKGIGRAAPQDVTVLILGESGTGKELIARSLYQHSRRADKPFLAINCAAIPETLLESELFGHERGAFTGADRKRIGKFEQCNGGTLFLDEIGDMTPLTQTKILRVLQEQRFERVGGNETVETDVRVIAATNRDLEKMVAEGQFRSDLYYRLSVFTVKLPPLRERAEDLPLLVEHFVRRFNRELGKEVVQVAPETQEALRQHNWPGNIRELQSALKQALLQARGPVLFPDFLPNLATHPARVAGDSGILAVSSQATPAPATAAPLAATAAPTTDWDQFIEERLATGTEQLYNEALETMERQLVARVLRHTNGNQLRAAKILGIGRGNLRTKIRALGISIERAVAAGSEGGSSPASDEEGESGR